MSSRYPLIDNMSLSSYSAISNGVCSCGHKHDDHFYPWDNEHDGEPCECLHTTEVIVGYRPKIVYSSNYTYGQFANSGYQAPIIHHTYGGNTLPYSPNSYSNTINNTTWIHSRGYDTPTTSTSCQENLEPVMGKKPCEVGCKGCDCKHCWSELYHAEQEQIRARNKQRMVDQAAALEWQKQQDIKWHTGTFAQRKALKGVLWAILKTLSDMFICKCEH